MLTAGSTWSVDPYGVRTRREVQLAEALLATRDGRSPVASTRTAEGLNPHTGGSLAVRAEDPCTECWNSDYEGDWYHDHFEYWPNYYGYVDWMAELCPGGGQLCPDRCGVAHDPCEPDGPDVGTVVAMVQYADIEGIRDALASSSVVLNESRKALQIRNCRGTILAHLPVGNELLSKLRASVIDLS
jgi:hypothetical protein